MTDTPAPRPEVVEALALAWVADDGDLDALWLRLTSRRWSTADERAEARAVAVPALADARTSLLAARDQLGARLRDRGATP